MFNLPVRINSRDPLTGSAIRVVLTPDGDARWSPKEAVVVAGSACAGASFKGCCQVLNFFAAPANAERYLAEHAEVNGHVISIADAAETGRRIFADVFAVGQ
jgi:Alkylmercury lyase